MKKWSADVQIPLGTDYKSRVVGTEFKESSKGNPMAVINWEIVEPSEVEIAGEHYNIAGVKCSPAYYTISKKDGDKLVPAQGREQLGLMFQQINVETVDWDNPPVSELMGKCFYTENEGKRSERRKPPTQAQIEAAKAKGVTPMGDVLKHPVTGKELVNFYTEVRQVFAAYPEGHVAMAY